MISALIQHLELADSGLFIHAPDGTCQRLAEALGDAGKPLAGLTETEDSQLAIEQLVDQLAVEPGHTLAATLEAASRLIGEPIYIVIDRAERLEHSDLTYALERMTRLQASAFFYAPLIDARKL